MKNTQFAITIAATLAASALIATANDEGPNQKLVGDRVPGEWIDLFNGENLEGWTPKFSGHEVGVNHKNVFRVEDGLLRVVYGEDYGPWDGAFGHLFHEQEFSHYILRVTYRFTGQQAPGGPGWAIRNNGIMFHGQRPEEMEIDQDFPDSIEFQMLGGSGTGDRATGSLCTPGTDVKIDGELTGRHVTESDGPTFHGDQWVTLELEVRGNDIIRHWADGRVILEYTHPQRNDGTPLESGTISIQAESAPTDFKAIQIKVLDPDAPLIPLEVE